MISCFLREIANVSKRLKFRSWHDNYQAVFPYLTCKSITQLYQIFALLGDIIARYVNQDILPAGNNLQHETHVPAMCLIDNICRRLKESMLSKTIFQFEILLTSGYYLKIAIEGIAQQPSPLENRQCNQDNQRHN